ncbi:phosphoglucosamine mutase [Ruminococcus sp.]|uniref:phosphoglucosamine mutase n=1 Tax=Ruminococcus sp. TaxID=41978 RepID=UPI0025E2626B|nr:phosphoglucosamine mutase [Ruminococcus sp.]MBQ8965608.1 phosphoglucosamine mutase [Ruminococcus sp.]
MGRLFGTDGARGVAITELTVEKALLIGKAAALVLAKDCGHRPKIIIGKDTRISGDILEAALCAGICAVGADVVKLGVIPTPAVAMLVKKYNADAGVMISASHNSVEFNGIKLFSGTGFKLPDDVENEIEELVLDKPGEMDKHLSEGTEVGRITFCKDAVWDYIRHVMKTVDVDLKNIKVCLDCANGSASVCAQKLFEGLGARVVMTNDRPDGSNINENCGSTHMEGLKKAVVENRCDVGLAFDGDADRCLAVDENGEVIDGDKLLAIFSKFMKAQRTLNSNCCVVTVMSNLGFFKFAKAEGIVTATTKVGDRYVLEEMLKGGYNIGGEQSGHIILLDHANTGDGEMTGAMFLQIMAKTGKKASELAACMESYPQVLVNVKITADKKGKWDKVPEITDAIKMYEEKLGGEGRILVRESGTEPLVRVMIEGKKTGLITDYAHRIADLIEKM